MSRWLTKAHENQTGCHCEGTQSPKQSPNVAGSEIASHPSDARNDNVEGFSDETSTSRGLTKGHENNPPYSPFRKGGDSLPPPLEKGGKGGFDRGFPKETLPDVTLAQLLQRPEIDYGTIENISPSEHLLGPEIKKAIEIEIKYDGYIKRQIQLIEKYKNMEGKQIPRDFDYASLSGLSREVTEKLRSIRPLSLGQASRIPGITPAAISILAIALAKRARERKA